MRVARRAARIAGAGVLAVAVVVIALVSLLVAMTPEVPAEFRPPRILAFDLFLLALAIPAVLILWRHPAHTIGWLFAGTAVLTALETFTITYAAAAIHGGRLPGGTFAAGIFPVFTALRIAPLITLVPLYFPDGRLPSARWRPVAWVALAGTASLALALAVLPAHIPVIGIENPFGAWDSAPLVFGALSASALLVCVTSIAAAASVVWRFRTAAAEVRQQIKWFAVAASVPVLVAVPVLVLELPVANSSVIFTLASTCIPAAVTLAILRYRLYDIDVLINRTLVYGLLTAALAATYFAGVVVLQAALRPLTGGSEVAVALSTLFVLALFAPLRRRIQGAVDRRFYRSRYDAVRTLDAFGAALRDEVDLDDVRADLVGVVGDTLRPAHVSLWLRDARR
jgi:hypothetical protein